MNHEMIDKYKNYIKSFLLVSLSFMFILLAYNEGVKQGINHVVPDAVDTQNRAIALAISRDVYGLKGYLGYRAVLNELINTGMTQLDGPIASLKLTYPDNVKSESLLNEALRNAISLDKIANASFTDKSLITGEYDDLGLTDYVRLAFAIFGINIQALYKLYFLLLGISVLFFCLKYYKTQYYLILCLLVACSIYFLIKSGYFSSQINVGTVWNQRFLSSLVVLPYCHIALAFFDKKKPSLLTIVAYLIQVLLLIFSITIRQSALWVFSVFLIFLIFIYFKQAQISFIIVAQRYRLLSFLDWRLIMLTLGLLWLKVLWPSTFHSVYVLDDFLSHRMKWHSAYLGLTVHPDWQKQFGPRHHNVHGDSISYFARQNYLREKLHIENENIDISPLSGTYKFGFHEKVMKLAYTDFILANKRYFTELMLRWKPNRIKELLVEYGQTALLGLRDLKRLLITIASFALIAWTLMGTTSQSRNASLWIVLTGALASLAPPLWAFPATHTFGEQFIVFTVACLFLIIASGAMLVSCIASRIERLSLAQRLANYIISIFSAKKTRVIVPKKSSG